MLAHLTVQWVKYLKFLGAIPPASRNTVGGYGPLEFILSWYESLGKARQRKVTFIAIVLAIGVVVSNTQVTVERGCCHRKSYPQMIVACVCLFSNRDFDAAQTGLVYLPHCLTGNTAAEITNR